MAIIPTVTVWFSSHTNFLNHNRNIENIGFFHCSIFNVVTYVPYCAYVAQLTPKLTPQTTNGRRPQTRVAPKLQTTNGRSPTSLIVIHILVEGLRQSAQCPQGQDRRDRSYDQRTIYNAQVGSHKQEQSGDRDHRPADKIGHRGRHRGPQIGAEKLGSHRDKQGPVSIAEAQ